MKVYELLSNKDNWTKGTAARDINDNPVGINDPSAVKFCLTGALMKCYPNLLSCEEKYSRIKKLCHGRSLADMNDEDGYEAVLLLAKRTDV